MAKFKVTIKVVMTVRANTKEEAEQIANARVSIQAGSGQMIDPIYELTNYSVRSINA